MQDELHAPCLGFSEESDEIILRRFRRNLLWLGLFGSYKQFKGRNGTFSLLRTRVFLSALLFFALGIFVPVLNNFIVVCDDCPGSQQQPFQRLVDFSESSLSAVSFFCLFYLLWKYGIRDLLLLDDRFSSDTLESYTRELKGLFPMLLKIILPFFLVELLHSILWFSDASISSILPLENGQFRLLLKIVMCCLVMVGWIFNNVMFLFMCLLFKFMCFLQILHLQKYYALVLHEPSCLTTDVGEEDQESVSSSVSTPSDVLTMMLEEHIRLRKQLLLISHRFRVFLVCALFVITLMQFLILFEVTASGGEVNFRRTGDLVLCCSLQLVGFVICLYAAAKITHMAQRIVAIVSQWHALASCAEEMFDNNIDQEDSKKVASNVLPPSINRKSLADDSRHTDASAISDGPAIENTHVNPCAVTHDSSVQGAGFHFMPHHILLLEQLTEISKSSAAGSAAPVAADSDELGDLQASLQLFRSTSKKRHCVGSANSDAISFFHKRHALVTYLQHCNAGISVYGFVLDRGCLYTIFAMELSIVLWTLDADHYVEPHIVSLHARIH